MSKKRPRSNKTEHRMAEKLDALAQFEQFQEDILPILQQALKEGWDAEKIFKHPKAQALLAARALTIGIMSPDHGKALSAISDVLNRTIGKPTEKQEIKHKMEKLGDDELDALLQTSLKEVEGDDEDMLN
jgi:hypothetical protein